MFQAIFTLSQVSAIITPRQNSYLNKKRIQNKDQTSKILCSDSFFEAVKNCDFNFARQFTAIQLFENNIFNNWKVSYVSTNSFFENKYGFQEASLYKHNIPTVVVRNNSGLQIPHGFYKKLLHSLKHESKFTFNVQVRTFKTDRSINAELKRNPSLAARLKNKLGIGSPEVVDQRLNTDVSVNNERLKNVLAAEDPNITDTEKQRIKIAFAEGYLLGNNPKVGKAARYFKIVQQVLTVAIFLAIVVSLMASASGSVFRYAFFNVYTYIFRLCKTFCFPFRIQLGNQVEVDPEEIHVTFEDVKGADEAKQELKDVVEFLKNPEKFSNLGGKLPKGVLLVGPPGNE